MCYLRRRNLGFSIDEWDSLPWWQTWLYDEMMIQDMDGTLAEYRNEPDPPPGEPFLFTGDQEDEYVPPADRAGVVIDAPALHIDPADVDAPKYDFPLDDEREHIAPVTYLPIERLGVRIRRVKPGGDLA